ncbi:ANKK1 [Symbiodinium sp. CCMP2456]|nr:ANKK1 [Symbiodinium sp. CCMP2456]
MAREGEGFKLETELHVAARQGDVEALKRLVASDTDVDKADVDLYTPLHRACDRKDAACVELLLGAQADPNVSHPGLDGWTPLHLAAWRDSRPCAALLLEAKADPGVLDWYGKTPLSLAGHDVKPLIRSKVAQAGSQPKGADSWENFRKGCVMQPSAVHLANIERCNQASQEHGEQQGEFCVSFDSKAGSAAKSRL